LRAAGFKGVCVSAAVGLQSIIQSSVNIDM
jgi:hypothetical protein